jgi:uncharacterized membrane protein YfcA
MKAIKTVFIGMLIGTLGGLIGLGGAEFRLPVLVSMFGFGTLDAVIINKFTSLIVAGFALPFRSQSIPWNSVVSNWEIILNILSGSLIGAWIGAHCASQKAKGVLDRMIMVLLVLLAIGMIFGHQIGHGNHAALISDGTIRYMAGLIAGAIIGGVAAILGVAGGELIIPTLILLYGVDIKIAGSLSLCISLPTMTAAFIRYSRSGAIKLVKKEMKFLVLMSTGSILGSAIGGKLIGIIPSNILILLLGGILLVSAIKTFLHSYKKPQGAVQSSGYTEP